MQASANLPANSFEVVGKNAMTQPFKDFVAQFEPRGLNQYPQDMDNSFQADMGEDYAQQIWMASIDYLKATLLENFDIEKGLNNQKIFSLIEDDIEEKQSQKESVVALILRNPLFSQNKTREQFLGDLKAQTNLQKLLAHLSMLFAEQIFHEICFFVHEAWEIYLKEKKKSALPDQLSKLFMRGFNNLDNIQETSSNTKYISLSQEEIMGLSKDVSEDLTSIYYSNSNINYLNLKECEQKHRSDRVIREEFQIFLQKLSNSLFHCLEGSFDSTETTNEPFLKSFSDLELPESDQEFSSDREKPTKKIYEKGK